MDRHRTRLGRISPSDALLLGLSLALLGAAGCANVGAPPPPAPKTADYRVGPPDQLEINVLPEPVIERTVVVRPDGLVSFDLVGDIQASGRTVQEIADDIQERLARFKRGATVSVSVSSSQSTQVTVLGEVRSNRSFPLVKETRVAEAIGLVGGTSPLAAKGRARIVRHEGERTVVLKVDLSAIQAGDLSTNHQLREGDIVVVPPTYMAQFGYFIQQFLFPFQPLIGYATATID